MVRRFVFVSIVLFCSMLPCDAAAQARRTFWGVDATFVPKWRVPEWQEFIFSAETIDLAGAEFRIGFVRGHTLGGDWGVSYVQRSIDDSAVAILDTDGNVTSTSNNSLVGVEANRFSPFTTIKDRVQIGLSTGIGVGWFRGNVQVRHPDGAIEELPARVLFSPGGSDVPVVPIGRLELAVAGIINQNLKVRASGGVNFPGQQTFSFSITYLFAPR
jgi:hypothetical protein